MACCSVRPDRADLGEGEDDARNDVVVHRRVVARNVLGGDLALDHRDVRQPRAPNEVADGVDALQIRPQMVVGDDAAAVELEPRLDEAIKPRRVRLAPHRDEHVFAVVGLLPLGRRRRDALQIAGVADALHARVDVDRDATLGERAGERQLTSASSLAMIDGSISTMVTFVPIALNMHASSTAITPPPMQTRLSGTFGMFIASSLKITLRPSRPGNGGRIGTEPFARIRLRARSSCVEPSFILTLTCPGVHVRRALENRHPVGLEQLAHAPGQLLHHLVLEGDDRLHVERRLGLRAGSQRFKMLAALVKLRDVQERLRRDAADVEARPADILLLDDADFARPVARRGWRRHSPPAPRRSRHIKLLFVCHASPRMWTVRHSQPIQPIGCGRSVARRRNGVYYHRLYQARACRRGPAQGTLVSPTLRKPHHVGRCFMRDGLRLALASLVCYYESRFYPWESKRATAPLTTPPDL